MLNLKLCYSSMPCKCWTAKIKRIKIRCIFLCVNFLKAECQIFRFSLDWNVCWTHGPGKRLKQPLGTLEHPAGRARLPVARGREGALCTAGSCWRMAVCCAGTRKQKVLSCWHHWGSGSSQWHLELVSLGVLSWRPWMHGCLRRRVMALMQRSSCARQKQKSRTLPCTCSYNFQWATPAPGVPGNVQAGGADPGGHIAAGCAQAAGLQAEIWKGTIKSFILCPAAPGNPGLGGLLKPIDGKRGWVFLLKYFGRWLMWTRSVCLLLVWGFHISHVH